MVFWSDFDWYCIIVNKLNLPLYWNLVEIFLVSKKVYYFINQFTLTKVDIIINICSEVSDLAPFYKLYLIYLNFTKLSAFFKIGYLILGFILNLRQKQF